MNSSKNMKLVYFASFLWTVVLCQRKGPLLVSIESVSPNSTTHLNGTVESISPNSTSYINGTEENVDHELDRQRHFCQPSTAGLFEGDIMGVKAGRIIGRNELIARKWTDNKLWYEISDRFTPAQKALIESGISEINSKVAALRITPRRNRADCKNYVSVEPGATGSGCSTYVGMIGGKQILNLEAANPCFVKGTILHDFMHAMGFWHEQSRTDRDQYIDLNLTNVNAFNRAYMFQKYTDPKIGDLGEPYDINSLMHYDKTSFAIDTNIRTVTAKFPNQNKPIGQKSVLTPVLLTDRLIPSNPFNIYVGKLLSANLIVLFFQYLPSVIAERSHGRWYLGNAACTLYELCQGIIAGVQMQNHAVMGVNPPSLVWSQIKDVFFDLGAIGVVQVSFIVVSIKLYGQYRERRGEGSASVRPSANRGEGAVTGSRDDTPQQVLAQIEARSRRNVTRKYILLGILTLSVLVFYCPAITFYVLYDFVWGLNFAAFPRALDLYQAGWMLWPCQQLMDPLIFSLTLDPLRQAMLRSIYKLLPPVAKPRSVQPLI
ncbi:putative Zinc metalloproteinase nas-14 [Hypsibius exemplaris]|uniref:Metalloendopeptidase n=1 Tax=Hypsibius exemplaris TaxID=2072580 RepID=A0A1W0X891_HYPEX|nr:putative Zinc metalloproteinase nas-14 [Hypsibius exemplaris]